MIINGVAMDGSMNAVMVFTIFKVENIRNIGIMMAAKGIIIAVSRMVNTKVHLCVLMAGAYG